MLARPRLYNVICSWRRHSHRTRRIVVVVTVRNDIDAKDAANEACLFLLWDRQGEVEPLVVIEGAARVTAPTPGIFDAADYDDYITFERGQVVACRTIE